MSSASVSPLFRDVTVVLSNNGFFRIPCKRIQSAIDAFLEKYGRHGENGSEASEIGTRFKREIVVRRVNGDYQGSKLFQFFDGISPDWWTICFLRKSIRVPDDIYPFVYVRHVIERGDCFWQLRIAQESAINKFVDASGFHDICDATKVSICERSYFMVRVRPGEVHGSVIMEIQDRTSRKWFKVVNIFDALE